MKKDKTTQANPLNSGSFASSSGPISTDNLLKSVLAYQIRRTLAIMGQAIEVDEAARFSAMSIQKLMEEPQIAHAAVILWRENEAAEMIKRAVKSEKAKLLAQRNLNKDFLN